MKYKKTATAKIRRQKKAFYVRYCMVRFVGVTYFGTNERSNNNINNSNHSKCVECDECMKWAHAFVRVNFCLSKTKCMHAFIHIWRKIKTLPCISYINFSLEYTHIYVCTTHTSMNLMHSYLLLIRFIERQCVSSTWMGSSFPIICISWFG